MEQTSYIVPRLLRCAPLLLLIFTLVAAASHHHHHCCHYHVATLLLLLLLFVEVMLLSPYHHHPCLCITLCVATSRVVLDKRITFIARSTCVVIITSAGCICMRCGRSSCVLFIDIEGGRRYCCCCCYYRNCCSNIIIMCAVASVAVAVVSTPLG